MNSSQFYIRKAESKDISKVYQVEKEAFETDMEAKLVGDLLVDETAQPVVSLLAFNADRPVGHILFSRAHIGHKSDNVFVYILAPLAVIPEYQNNGIGGALIKNGLDVLRKTGTDLVFVLGYPTYYSKHGFIPDANSFGFPAPFPILEKNKDAWMIQSLTKNGLKSQKGIINCADALNKIECWTE